jgi:hypothetical protein
MQRTRNSAESFQRDQRLKEVEAVKQMCLNDVCQDLQKLLLHDDHH